MEGATHSRRGSLLPRPRVASSSSDQEPLLPRQASSTYSVSSRQSSASSIPPRPIPPTPRRMMSPPGLASVAKTKHRRRQSGIPRLASGSSRRDSFSQSAENPSTTERAAAQRLSQAGHGNKPPSSWRVPQFTGRRPDQSTSNAVNEPDLSGRLQQLPIQHHATQSVSDPAQLGRSPLHSLPISLSLPKLLAPRQEATPRHRLMKPIDPPLPPGPSPNLSCLTSMISTSSPAKARPESLSRTPGNQVDVIRALHESRMTDEEIVALNQVRREAEANEEYLRHSFRIKHYDIKASTKLTTPSTAFTKKYVDYASNVSSDNLEKGLQHHGGNIMQVRTRPLTINTQLANSYTSSTALATFKTIDSVISSSPEDEWETNIKLVCSQSLHPHVLTHQVHFSEAPAYWAGRYMTICNRLRTEEMNAPGSSSPSSSYSSDRSIDSSDIRRMRKAFSELRACCRTTQALQSLEAFETQLRKNLNVPPTPKSAAIDGTNDLDTEEEAKVRVAHKRRREQVSSSPTQTKAPLVSTKLEQPLPNIWSRLALPKSKTTNNLLGTYSESDSRLPPATQRPQPGDWMSPHHARRASRPDRSLLDTKTESQMRQLLKTSVKSIQQRLSAPRLPSYGSRVSSNGSAKSENKTLAASKTMPHLRKASTTTAQVKPITAQKMSGFEQVAANLAISALETGRPPPPQAALLRTRSKPSFPPSVRSPAPVAMGSSISTGMRSPPLIRIKSPITAKKTPDSEKTLRSRRLSSRKSSGEVIKGVFGAGAKQVKHMSRRSVNWLSSPLGSQEDLSINVLSMGR